MRCRLAWSLLAAAAVVSATPGPARAHPFDVYPEQYQLLAPPGPAPQRLVLASTYGLVLSDDGGATWRWVCEIAFGVAGAWAPEYEVTARGVITATTANGLQLSPDGCGWTAAAGAAGTATAAATAIGGDGALWLASIAAGAEFRRSADDGATWTDVAPLPEVLWVASLAVAPSDPQRLYVSGDAYAATVRVPGLWRSTDGAAQWTQLDTASFAVTAGSTFHVDAVDPADPDRVFVRVTATGATREERVYRSIDGGDTWTEVLRVSEYITGVVVRGDGTVVVSTRSLGLYRSIDRGATFSPIAGPRLKATCLAELGDLQLYVCADNFGPDYMGLGRSVDAAAWTKLMTMTELAGPLACPVGTIQRDECQAGAWCFFKTTYAIASDEVSCGTTPVDAGIAPPPEPPVCGCGATRGGAGTGLGLGLGVGLRLGRRRRRRR